MAALSELLRMTGVLAHAPGLPDGDLDRRLVLVAALDRAGALDAEAFGRSPDSWIAIEGGEEWLRFSHEEEGWSLVSAGASRRLRFEAPIRPGALFCVQEAGGDATYRVVAVTPAG